MFLFSRLICSNISEAIFEFADLAPDLNHIHKELSKARIRKILKILPHSSESYKKETPSMQSALTLLASPQDS